MWSYRIFTYKIIALLHPNLTPHLWCLLDFLFYAQRPTHVLTCLVSLFIIRVVRADPGPYSHRTVDYSDFFYVLAIQKTLMWAQRLNIPADVARYSSLLDAAKALYLKTYYTPATACFADCMYVSQIFGLSLEVIPSGSAEEAAVWANALSWFNGDGKNAKVRVIRIILRLPSFLINEILL